MCSSDLGNTSDIFNPASGTWTPAANMTISYRFNYNYAKLPSGKVLFAGGGSGGETSEVYDPVADRWVSAGLLNVSRGYSGDGITSPTVVLSGESDRFAADSADCGNDCGKVLLAGHTDDRSAELYTPPPIVRELDRTSGTPGTVVTITGQGFTHNVKAVLFGSTPASSFTAESYGRLTAVAPAGTGAVKITVVNEGGESTSGQSFTHVAPPPPPPPPPVGPGTPNQPNAVVRRKGKLSARVTPPRRLRAPYRFRMTGKLTLPTGVSRAVGCRGRVTVRVLRGRTTVATRRPSLTSTCTYSVRISFASRRTFRASKRLRFTARFGGNTRVLPVTAKSRYARVRR